MNTSIEFKKLHNKILGHMKTFNAIIDHILVHFVGSKVGLYVSFRIPLYLVPFLSEAIEASQCYFFENWLMNLKYPNLRIILIPSNTIL